MENIIKLWDFSLYQAVPENVETFMEVAKISDIYDEWKEKGLTIEKLQESSRKYISYICDAEAHKDWRTEFCERYWVKEHVLFLLLHWNNWIGDITHNTFYKHENEMRLWNKWITLFESFRWKWLGTAFTALWLEYLWTVWWMSAVYASCDDDNKHSIALLSKFWKRTPENDYFWVESQKTRLTFALPTT